MTWNRDTNMIVFESIVTLKKLYLQNVERVMILNCFRINFIIRKLHSSCDWSSNIFSLYDLFETWLFDMIVRINCFKNCIYKTLNTSRHMIVRINCIVKKIAFIVLLFSNSFLLYNLIVIWSFLVNVDVL